MTHTFHEETARSPAVRTSFLSNFGLFLGLLFFAASLTPSLVPRTALMQGLLGGALFAFGYFLAIAGMALWRWLGLGEPARRPAQILAALFALFGLVLAYLALSQTPVWQNSIRTLMEMPDVESAHRLTVAGIAVATAAGLFMVALFMRLVFHLVHVNSRRLLPERVAILIGLLVAALFFWTLGEGVLVRYTLHVLDRSFAALDALIEPDIAAPTEPFRVGSPASLLDWQELGRDGRRFVSRTPTAAAIGAFWSAPAKDPLRVYIGLGAADDVEARAALALAELERVGGFEREVLVVAVPTGTGFMEEGAIASLEYLFRGDVATVAIQYSYLQSPFSLIFEPGYGADAARALLRVVYDRWTQMPHDARPRLYLQGLSLGALSSERSVRLHEMLGDPIGGAVWSGPPFPSPIHRAATEERNAGSPAWRPVLDRGEFIRFTLDGTGLDDGAAWGPTRIVYIQHASDPIVFFDFDILWRAPDWLKAPRGPDVSPMMRWYPVVTALQIAADMALSNDAPIGHGHQYGADAYIDAWMAVADPEVSEADVRRLKAHFPDGRMPLAAPESQ